MIPRFHVVTDTEVLRAPRFLHRAEGVIRAGGERLAFHLRGPGMDGGALLSLGRDLQPVARRRGARLLVNDRVDVARILDADGVHLPERGLPPSVARRQLAEGSLVGRSLHGPDPMDAGERPDFLLLGTLYSTASHPGRAGVGPALVAEVARIAGDLPVIGIGGITPERVQEVVAAGGRGVAVLSGVWNASDPAAAVTEYLSRIGGEVSAATKRDAERKIELVVNGKEHVRPRGETVEGLLESLGLAPGTVVVERNRDILDRSAYAETTLQEGDHLELVHFVGGG